MLDAGVVEEDGKSEVELIEAVVVLVAKEEDCVFDGVSTGYVGVPDFGRYTMLISSSFGAARNVSAVGFPQSNASPGS